MEALFSHKLSYITILLLLLISVSCKAVNSVPGLLLRLSEQERDEIIGYSGVSYAYLGNELSDIIKIIG